MIEQLTELIRGVLMYILFFLNSFSSVVTQDSAVSVSSVVIEKKEASQSAHFEDISQVPLVVNTTSSPQFISNFVSPPPAQYQIEDHPSGQEGFYVLKNAPWEPMSTVEELNKAVNIYRQTHQLNTLEIEQNLCLISQQRALEANETFSHERFGEHVENGDYDYVKFNVIGENLWDGSFSGVHIVEYGWDKSVGHRANLQGDWQRGCAGIFEETAVFIFAK